MTDLAVRQGIIERHRRNVALGPDRAEAEAIADILAGSEFLVLRYGTRCAWDVLTALSDMMLDREVGR